MLVKETRYDPLSRSVVRLFTRLSSERGLLLFGRSSLDIVSLGVSSGELESIKERVKDSNDG